MLTLLCVARDLPVAAHRYVELGALVELLASVPPDVDTGPYPRGALIEPPRAMLAALESEGMGGDLAFRVRELVAAEAPKLTPAMIPCSPERGALAHEVVTSVLFRTWWLTPEFTGGYCESDLCGTVDCDVEPGTVGRGLVDIECEAFLEHSSVILFTWSDEAGERIVRKVHARMAAFSVQNGLRTEREERESRLAMAATQGTANDDSSDDDDGDDGGGYDFGKFKAEDAAFLAANRRDGRSASHYDCTATLFATLCLKGPSETIEDTMASAPWPNRCSNCGASAKCRACSGCRAAFYCTRG